MKSSMVGLGEVAYLNGVVCGFQGGDRDDRR